MRKLLFTLTAIVLTQLSLAQCNVWAKANLPSSMDTMEINENPINLTWGTPLGGTYTIYGGNTGAITNNTLDPSLLSPGKHYVCYAYKYNNAWCAEMGDTVPIFIEMSTHISEATEKTSFNVFPNPANDYLDIKVDKANNQLLEIFDNQGKIVHQQYVFQSTMKLSTTDLNNGLYFIKITDNGSFELKKFMKM